MNKAAEITRKKIKISYNRKTHFFCKNILLYITGNRSVVVEIFVCKFCYILKMMSRYTLPEPQPESASYGLKGK